MKNRAYICMHGNYITFSAAVFILGLFLGGVITLSQAIIFAIGWAAGMIFSRTNVAK